MWQVIKWIVTLVAAIILTALVSLAWHYSKLLSVSALVGFALLTIVVLYQEKLRSLRKLVSFYGPVSSLKPSDIRVGAKWYDPFYIEPAAVTKVVGMLNANRNIVLLGVPLLGKTRCAFEILRRLRGFHVLIPRTEIQSVAEIEIPRTYFICKPKIILFLDDLQNYEGKFSPDDLCRHLRVQSKSLSILATCRIHDDWRATQRDPALRALVAWELEEIHLEKLSPEDEQVLTTHFGREWHETAYGGRPGFIVLGLEQMKNELLRVTQPDLDLMRGLNLMHEAGLRSYRCDLALKAAQLLGSQINRLVAEHSFKSLRDVGFLAIQRRENLVSPTHESYLETSFSFEYLSHNIEDLKALWKIVSDDGHPTEIFDVALHCLRRGEVAMPKGEKAMPFFAIAEQGFWRFLELVPTDPVGHYYLAIVLRNQGENETAEAKLREAIRYNPEYADAHYELGVMQDCFFDSMEKSLYQEEDELNVYVGDSDQPEFEYRETIRCNRNHAAAHYRLGVRLLDRGWEKENEAEAEFREAIRGNSKYARGHLGLGRILDSRGLSVEAERHYEQAIGADSDLSYAHYRLGLLMARRDERSRAEAEYREAIRSDPTNAEAYDKLGWLLHDEGRLEEAEQELREAILLQPNFSTAHNSLGVVLMDQGRIEESIAEYEEALRCDSSNFYAHTNLGLIFDRQGKFEQAEKKYREGLSFSRSYPEVHCKLGYVLEEQNHFDEAENEYLEAIRLSPNYSRAHDLLGALLENKKLELVAAEEEYRKAVSCDPKNSNARANLGWLLLIQKRDEEAELELREALVHDPESARAHNFLGLSLSYRKLWDEAEAELRKAIEWAPDWSIAHLNLGWIRSERGDVGEAEEEYRKAILLDPRDSMPHNNLGNVLAERGELIKAEKHYREAISSNPDNTLPYRGLAELLRQRGCLKESMQSYQAAADHLERGAKIYLTVISLAAVKEEMRTIEGRLSRLEDAELEYRKAIERDPTAAEGHNKLGVVLYNRDKYAEAAQAFEKALRIDNTRSDVHYMLGMTLNKLGRLEEAAAEFSRSESIEAGKLHS